jgi:uncharacterized membrane protein YagU involved in acid resistance
MKHRSMLWALLVGGSIAGALDILFAIISAGYSGVSPTQVLHSIASGALGKAAFSGGMPVAALGLALHFLLSFAWAGLFLVAAGRAPVLTRRPLISAIAFGLVVFVLMRCVVLPLSAFPLPLGFKLPGAALDLLSHMFLFGLPIAMAARRAMVAGKPGRA